MADPERKLILGILIIILTIGMGISQANNANNFFEESNHEAISLAQSQNAIKVINISNNQSLTDIQASALHDIIYKPGEDYVVNGKRLAAHDSIRAELGQTFSISLESNPTTGYIWTVDFDQRFLNGVTELNGTISSMRPMLIGTGGQQIFSFTPIKEGQTIISAIYKRPWEETAAEKRIFLIIILPSCS
ncbi:MAG: protease inhibitor I42 family protein [Methanothrix sp.]|nr:protease inhibitor I42 family protein [Methanothrix sp.]